MSYNEYDEYDEYGGYGGEYDEYGGGGGYGGRGEYNMDSDDDLGDDGGIDEYDFNDFEASRESREMKDSYKDRERVGGAGELLLPTAINLRTSTAYERFKYFTNVNALKMMNSGYLTSEEVLDILSKIDLTKRDANFLNPTGFILGYIVSSGGYKLSDKQINKVFENLSEINKLSDLSPNIKRPDVLRYGRYMMRITK